MPVSSKFTAPAVAAAAVIGGGVYMSNKNHGTSNDAAQDFDQTMPRGENADGERDIFGGGVGMGGPEVDHRRKNSNAASIELGPGGSGSTRVFSGLLGTSKTAQSSSAGRDKTHREHQTLGQTLTRFAGTGGASSREQFHSDTDPRNTKIMSTKTDIPSKRIGSPWDRRHHKTVTAVEPTTENHGTE